MPSLPPRFLLPSWNSSQLRQLARLSQSNPLLQRNEHVSVSVRADRARHYNAKSNEKQPKKQGYGQGKAAAKARPWEASQAVPAKSQQIDDDPLVNKQDLEGHESQQIKRPLDSKHENHGSRASSQREGDIGKKYGVPPASREDAERFVDRDLGRFMGSPYAAEPVADTIQYGMAKDGSDHGHPWRGTGVDKRQDSSLYNNSSVPSLFEELFPAESKRDKAQAPPLPSLLEELQLPELDLPPPASPLPEASLRRGRSVASLLRRRIWDASQLTVLAIMGLSPSLSLSDFERLIPKGEHIEAWRSPGDVLHVIPGRIRTTLEPQAIYYLVFADIVMAKAYKAHLEHLHAIAREFTPTSMLSKDIPGSGYYVRGENIHQIIQDYTLCPPSQDLKITMYIVPKENTAIKNLLDAKGYREFKNTTEVPKSGRSAVVWIEGGTRRTGDIGNAQEPDGLNRLEGEDSEDRGDGSGSWTVTDLLRRDSVARGLHWGALGPHGDIVTLGSAGSGRRPRIEAKAEIKTDAIIPGPSPSPTEATPNPTPPSLDSHPRRPFAPAPANRTDSRPQRWLVTFANETEARRFVRHWHRRPLPDATPLGSSQYKSHTETVGRVFAEFAW